MTDRSRIRRGRTVSYTPTAAEVTANGEGPWLGMITVVNADGTVELMLDVPGGTVTTAKGSDAATTQALANALKVAFNAQRKTAVQQGSQAGQFSLLQTGPQAL